MGQSLGSMSETSKTAGENPFAGFKVNPPSYARWTRERLSNLNKEMLFSITNAFDDALNNTSLILLFEVNGVFMLFPGDAQWENWQYALSKENYLEMLRKVSLYKVGHHGSRNATPKALWNNFECRSEPDAVEKEMKTVVSTMLGVHGESEETFVPSRALMKALEGCSKLHSTSSLKYDTMVETIEINF